jgi:hypothetical protein
MTENTNEIAIVETHGLTVHAENENYVTYKDENGKFSRKAKYHDFSSYKAESRADKIWLLNLLEGAEDSGIGLKEMVGKNIEVAHIITRPYDSIDEDTGFTVNGVLTYLIAPDKTVYVTSAKAVYFTVNRTMELFGTPNDADWENVTFAVYKEKGANGDMVKIKMVG